MKQWIGTDLIFYTFVGIFWRMEHLIYCIEIPVKDQQKQGVHRYQYFRSSKSSWKKVEKGQTLQESLNGSLLFAR